MQSVIVAVLVLACLAAVLRGIWRQFAARGSAGCGGCSGAAQGCSQAPKNACPGSHQTSSTPALMVRRQTRPQSTK